MGLSNDGEKSSIVYAAFNKKSMMLLAFKEEYSTKTIQRNP